MKGEPKMAFIALIELLFCPGFTQGINGTEAEDVKNLKKDILYIIDTVYDTPATEKDQTIIFNKIINKIKSECYPNK